MRGDHPAVLAERSSSQLRNRLEDYLMVQAGLPAVRAVARSPSPACGASAIGNALVMVNIPDMAPAKQRQQGRRVRV